MNFKIWLENFEWDFQNATVQNREEDIKKLHPAYQKLAFPLGDARVI